MFHGDKVVVTDANDPPVKFDGRKSRNGGIWVAVDKESGFGWPVGVVQYTNALKELPSGEYGA